ncbi:MAG: U32 family peptidase [Candidatus Solibacter usitatus]|nr:U32 family peptidase [Candidatus Solibacter usitatus]
MSPAGYWPQLRAAIEAGADAVYLGLQHFTARAKVGFTEEELPDVMRALHERGVRGYVTFNTLVFDSEWKEAELALTAIANAGADAIIVQDLGAATLAREIAPDLEVHGSTQMSITSAEGVEHAAGLGVKRVVLARELSLPEIRAIRASTNIGLEMFVHGALCVSYSGQCLSSEAWGGRSANRGQCAQACRLPYALLVDGEEKPLGDARYLLSPGDLYTLRQIPEIVRVGVSSLKIEGRYKDAEYVALTTGAYRKAVDEACAGSGSTLSDVEELRLEQVYSRGLGPYFVSGTNHQEVVKGRAPRHRGVLMGRVANLVRGGVILAPSGAHSLAPLKPGDGVVFDAADWRSPQEKEEGGAVYVVIAAGNGQLELRFANDAIDWQRVRLGDQLWRTHDADIDKAARVFLDPAAPVHRQPVAVRVRACAGEPLRAIWKLPYLQVNVEGPVVEVAKHRASDEEWFRLHLGKLGNTPYTLTDLHAEIEGSVFAPASMLNQLRRDAVALLQSKQRTGRKIAVHESHLQIPVAKAEPASLPSLHLLVRTAEQLEAAINTRPSSITLDYLDLYGLQPAVDCVREAGIAVRVAGPRVLKPGEERIVQFLRKLGCGILVRSTGLLHTLREDRQAPLTGDFSLNAANAFSTTLLLSMGLDRITPAHDLNAAQVTELASKAGGGRLEVVVYHHLPVFHTEHCVFCRFLSSGTSYLDCGRPCEKHRVELRDENGRAHPVMADVGCRNTVFGAEAQQASAHLKRWREAGIAHYRLEFVHESARQVESITTAFTDALAGLVDRRALEARLRKHAPGGLTEGSLRILN